MNTKEFLKNTLYYFLLTFFLGWLLAMFVEGDIALKETTRGVLVLIVLSANLCLFVIRFLMFHD